MWPKSDQCSGFPNPSSGWKLQEWNLCASPFFPGSRVWYSKAMGVTNSRSMCPQGKSGNSFKKVFGDIVWPLGHCSLGRHGCPSLVTVSTSSKSSLFSKDEVLCVEERRKRIGAITSDFRNILKGSVESLGGEGDNRLNPVQAPHQRQSSDCHQSLMVLKSSDEIFCLWGRRKDEDLPWSQE